MQTQKSNWLIPTVACSLALLAVAYAWFGDRYRDVEENLVRYERHESAPAFEAPLEKFVLPSHVVGKAKITGEDLKGQTYLLHFFASWCRPCREERPLLKQLVETYSDGSLMVIGLASYETQDSLRKSGLLSESPFTVGLDEEGLIAQAFRIRAIPQSVLIDSQGRIRYRVQGVLNTAEMNFIGSMVQQLKEEQASAVKHGGSAQAAPQLGLRGAKDVNPAGY